MPSTFVFPLLLLFTFNVRVNFSAYRLASLSLAPDLLPSPSSYSFVHHLLCTHVYLLGNHSL